MIDPGLIAIQLSKCYGSHYFHSSCITESFMKCKKECPCCRIKYGITTGNQPNGIMRWKFDDNLDCDGDENKDKGTIIIVHEFQSGIQTQYHSNPGQSYFGDARIIYLPNTEQGREILELTKIA